MALSVTLLLLMVASGVLGRMGGAGKSGSWYDKILDTKWRDIGGTLVLMCAIYCFFGYNLVYWWAYLLTALLTFGSFTTYWDELFHGEDNLWFSGAVTGLAAFPLVFVDPIFYWIVPVRAVILCISWGCLNKYLPQNGFLCWRRDVVEEFSRYAISL